MVLLGGWIEKGWKRCHGVVVFPHLSLLVPLPQISEYVEGITVVCQEPLDVHSEDRQLKYRWKFKVYSQVSPALCDGFLGDLNENVLVVLSAPLCYVKNKKIQPRSCAGSCGCSEQEDGPNCPLPTEEVSSLWQTILTAVKLKCEVPKS